MCWDSELWVKSFQKAKQIGDQSEIHRLRQEVFFSTVKIVREKKYEAFSTIIPLDWNEQLPFQTKMYKDELFPMLLPCTYETKTGIIAGDCLAVAEAFYRLNEEVCVLNMANRRNPGGGVYGGAGAQEEYLFRCSDYFRSLYQYAPYAGEYGLQRSADSYPLDRDFGGCYSPDVTIFRGREEEGYPLLREPWKANFIAVPAMNRPELKVVNGVCRIADRLVLGVKNKIRTILRIAIDNAQRTLILGAFGCGAFRNPPLHIAELFYEILSEEEFCEAFRYVIFAIKEDHNSRGEGNVQSFRSVFGDFKF